MNPRLIARFLGAFLLLLSLHTPAAAQEITNIQAAQRPGTNLVDIDYDLTGITAPVRITLEVSDDDGLTWDVPGTTLSGDAGDDVAPATGLRLTWDAGRDWGGRVSDTMRYKVVADPFPPPVGFATIPGGWFVMGDPLDGDANATAVNVYVSEFYMATHEVTKALWDEVREWGLNNGYTDLVDGSMWVGVDNSKGADHPVHTVGWWDAVRWCNARSEMEGLTPVYTVGGEVFRAYTYTQPAANWNADGYRLPTEAEWEKAARGGLSGKRFPWGNEINHDHANYQANGSSHSYDTSPYTTLTYHPTYNDGTMPYTAPVGSYASNGYGLHDMAGNVREWCWDWATFGSTYTEDAIDPKGDSIGMGGGRVVRGGSWNQGAFSCRSAYRRYLEQFDPGGSNCGFRVARSVPPLSLAEYEATHESGQYSLRVNTPGSWTAESDQVWVTVTPASGDGPTTVLVEYQPHDEGSFPRTATLTIGGQTHTITQQPAPNEIGTLQLIAGGTLNGGEIDAGNRALTVEPGAPITGQVRVRADNRMPSGAVTPLGGTAVWGDRTTAFWMTQSNFATGIEEFDMPIDLTAPEEPGTYHILLTYEGEFNMAQVMSRTNWTAGDVVWNNGIDAGFDWTPEQFQAATTLGAVRGKLLTQSGLGNRWMPATVIEVVVVPPSDNYGYWVSDADGTPNLYRAAYHDGQLGSQQQLTFFESPKFATSAFQYNPTINRIGIRVLHGSAREDGRFYTLSPDGTDLRQESNLPFGAFDFSPDGASVIFSMSNADQGLNHQEAYLLDMETGNHNLIIPANQPRGSNTHKTSYVWLPDNRILFSNTAVWSDFAGQHDIHVYDDGAFAPLQSNTASGEQVIDLSPDGTLLLIRQLASGSGVSGVSYIRWPDDDGQTVVFPKETNGRVPTGWENDSTFFFNHDGQVFSSDLDGTEIKNLSEDWNITGQNFRIFQISGATSGEIIFTDDFENGLVQWNSFGVPAPVVVAAQGRDAVLDVNGDSSWNSGVWTIQEIELRVGTVISFDVFLDVTNPAGCWVDIACGITNGQPSGQPEGQMSVHQLGRFHFEGDACWATPEEFRPHAYLSSFGLPLEQARMADAYLGAWQTMTLEVLEDFRIRATLGGDLVSESPNAVDPDFRAGHLQIYGRSSGSAGKAYVDNVMVKSGGDDPTPPEGFALIPAGEFTMGRTSGDTDSSAPPVNVHVSEFYMATHAVTWELWQEVRTWGIDNGYTDIATGGGKAADHPVHTVNWWDVVKWCNARSEMDGLTPVYTVGGDVMRTGTTEPEANWNANGYRLPTEAEWEKAARGGVAGQRFPWGDEINHDHANYRVYSSNGTTNHYSYDVTPRPPATGTNYYHPTYNDGISPLTSPVGSFAPNSYGLYDMTGNVWEWNWDWYEASTYTEGASDPKGAASGSSRVLRGGGWFDLAFGCRSASRINGGAPGVRGNGIGFRPARSSVP